MFLVHLLLYHGREAKELAGARSAALEETGRRASAEELKDSPEAETAKPTR